MGEGDVLAHPFTRLHPGGFVSAETGEVHPVIWEALERGVVVDVGHGSHFSFDMARRTLDAGNPSVHPRRRHARLQRSRAPARDERRGAQRQPVRRRRALQPHHRHDRAPGAGTRARGGRRHRHPPTPRSSSAWRTSWAAWTSDARADVSVLDVLKGRFVLSDNSGAEVVTDTPSSGRTSACGTVCGSTRIRRSCRRRSRRTA